MDKSFKKHNDVRHRLGYEDVTEGEIRASDPHNYYTRKYFWEDFKRVALKWVFLVGIPVLIVWSIVE